MWVEMFVSLDGGEDQKVLVQGKDEPAAKKALSKFYRGEKISVSSGIDYDTLKDALEGKSPNRMYAFFIDSNGRKIDNGGRGKTGKELNKYMNEDLQESFNVHYPQLKKLVNMEYGDPRQKDGCSIVAEKCGKIKNESGDVVDGSYIMYEDSEMPGKYIAVHVSDSINEDSESPDVKVIAIGSKKSVRERMGYRIRRNKSLEENKVTVNKILIEDKKMLEFNRRLNGKMKKANIMDEFDKGIDEASGSSAKELKSGMILKGPNVEVGGMAKIKPKKTYMIRVKGNEIYFHKPSGTGKSMFGYYKDQVSRWIDDGNLTIVKQAQSPWGG